MLEEIAASGAAMNGCSAIHLSIFGMDPVRRYGSPELQGRCCRASPPASCTSRSA